MIKTVHRTLKFRGTFVQTGIGEQPNVRERDVTTKKEPHMLYVTVRPRLNLDFVT
jgi:hypothetical protein